MQKNAETDEINGIVEDIKIFMPKLIEACYIVSDRLYKPLTEETWETLGDVVEGMDDLYRTLNTLHASIGHQSAEFYLFSPTIAYTVAGIQEKFAIVNGYMDEEEYTNAGDFIRYEWIPLLEQFTAELGPLQAYQTQQFAANMRFLKEHLPQLYARLSRLEADERHYYIAFAKNGAPNLALLGQENKPLYLHSRFDPVHEANRQANLLMNKVQNKTKIVMYGFGLGYLAESYAAVYPEHELYIYEPDEQIFFHAMHVIDLRATFSRLNLKNFVVDSEGNLRTEFLEHYAHQKGQPELVVFPAYMKFNKTDQEIFYYEAKKSLQKYANFLLNTELFGLTWTRNAMYNLNSVLSSPPITGLYQKFRGETAIIVGAGPSLEQEIETLRQLKEHVLIIAAGSSIQTLLHFHIEPHMVVSIDGTEYNYKVFEKLNMGSIPLLFSPTIEHRIIEKNSSALFHAFITGDTTSVYFMEHSEEDPIFMTTHSVTGTAIQAAIYMGCAEIVFIGQDLSYPTGKMYSAGAKHIEEAVMNSVLNKAELQVENVRGAKNRTNQAMLSTLGDMEDLLAQFPDICFTNTSKIGAKIKYTAWQPLEDVLLRVRNEKVDSRAIIDQVASLKKYENHRIQRVRDKVVSLADQLQQCGRALEHISGEISKLPEIIRQNAAKCPELIAEIDRDWEHITQGAPFKGLYMRACAGALKQFEVELPKLGAAKTIREQVTFYCDVMQPLIAEMIGRIPELMEIAHETQNRLTVKP